MSQRPSINSRRDGDWLATTNGLNSRGITIDLSAVIAVESSEKPGQSIIYMTQHDGVLTVWEEYKELTDLLCRYFSSDSED